MLDLPSKGQSWPDIRKAYVEKMKCLHPDVNHHKDTTIEAAQVTVAYQAILEVIGPTLAVCSGPACSLLGHQRSSHHVEAVEQSKVPRQGRLHGNLRSPWHRHMRAIRAGWRSKMSSITQLPQRQRCSSTPSPVASAPWTGRLSNRCRSAPDSGLHQISLAKLQQDADQDTLQSCRQWCIKPGQA